MDGTASQPTSAMRLTPRQRECLGYVYQRLTSKEIAGLTGLAVGTVDTYITEAVTALGARNRRHAAELLHSGQPADIEAPRKLEPEETGVESAPSQPLAPEGRTEMQHWAAWLPFRFQGALGNDLGPIARLVAIVVIAVALAIGFGMLAVGMRTLSDLLAVAR